VVIKAGNGNTVGCWNIQLVNTMKWMAQNQYASCQLVAATNAALYYKLIQKPTKVEWERLVDLTLCRYGSCLAVEKAHKEFGLLAVDIPQNLDSIRRQVVKKRPVEVGVWLERVGFHAVLVVGYGRLGYRVLNYHKHQASPLWVPAQSFADAFNHIQPGTMVRSNCYFAKLSA